MEVLNGQFEQADDYFGIGLEFLAEYRWIFKSRNTDILTDHILDRISQDWIPIFQLDSLDNIQLAVRGEAKTSWPPELIEFVKQCWRLSLTQIDAYRKDDDVSKWKKVNPKKVHEVVNFAQLIGENCAVKHIRHAVDIGAGLGYLDKELSERWNIDVLGLERDAYRVTAANQRSSAETNAPNQSRATFKELTVVDSECLLEDQVESMVSNWLLDQLQCIQSPPLCMIGLHSCGDLSPVMMELFLKNKRFRTLLLVSCCYHRMEWQGDPPDGNFPLCNSLKTATSFKCGDAGVPFHQQEGIQQFFRLAAQETPKHWLHNKDLLHHRRQARHTFYRALIQLYAVQEGIQLQKQQRRPVKKENISVEDYVKQAVEGFGLQGGDAEHREKLMELYRCHKHLLPAMETLVILQVLLQPVAEALILVDRIVYLRDNGIPEASLLQIFDDRISPRCFVTIASKALYTTE